jgi:hypothetical protein
MRLDLFSIPVFIDKVDLTKISISDEPTKPLWLSGVQTTMGEQHVIADETKLHLIEIFNRNLGNLVGANARFGQIWRNKYTEHDWQDIHIHPHCQWSFIIYEDVIESKTVFMNPNYKDIQNHMGMNLTDFPSDYRPSLKTGDILIFPSFLEHFVMPGNTGSTISGNLYMDYQ